MKSTSTKTMRAITPLFMASLLLSLINTTPRDYMEQDITSVQRGVCFTAWQKDRLMSPYSDKALEKASSAGIDHIQIITTYYQKTHASGRIESTDRTPSVESIVHAIRKSRELGLRIMLKPHVDMIKNEGGSLSRSDIGAYTEEQGGKWFSSYRDYILKYARLAEDNNVDIYCIGTELSYAAENTGFWKSLIKEVRRVYKGKLTYAANWDNYDNIGFWEDLDYAGIDAYFPLSHSTSPSLEEIKQGWLKRKKELKRFHERISRPILFTEIGYPSAPHAAATPWLNGYSGNADPAIQAKCYSAFFQTMWGTSWLKGVYWWRWNPSVYSGGLNNRHFTPQNKPAQKLLETHFKGLQKNEETASAENKWIYGHWS